MSRIFDALQRSEAEHSGTDPAAFSELTEVLRRAERRAVSRWKTAVLTDQTDGTIELEGDRLPGSPSKGPISTQTDALPTTEVWPSGKSSDPFGPFQSLAVALSPESRLPCLTDSGNLAAEAFRLLGVRLRHLRRDRPLKKVLITSTIPQEGKSMVAANLACTLALKTEQRTLVLEGDLRRPYLSQMFGLGTNPGVSEWLEGSSTLTTSIYHLEGPNIWILPAGSAPSNALELLQSGRLISLMNQLNELFDWIIIDSPPVLPFADASVWMRLADGILLTTRQGTTKKRQLKRGLEALESDKLIGALLNSSKHAADGSDYYYSSARASKSDELSLR
jgi:capsular exopolysaccharide synthesis family protein